MSKEGAIADNVFAKLLKERNAATPPESEITQPTATQPTLNLSYCCPSLQSQFPGISQETLKSAFDSAERQDSISYLQEVTLFFQRLGGQGAFDESRERSISTVDDTHPTPTPPTPPTPPVEQEETPITIPVVEEEPADTNPDP